VSRIRYDRLPTERANPSTGKLDRLSAAQIARLMNRADRRAVRAVGRAAPALGRAVDLIVRALSRRGRLIFVGAGTSGRLGVLEAAECPPTFDTPPSLVQAVIAGGKGTVFRSSEGAEDDGPDGARQIRRRVRPGDMVVGIAASGVTPFVRAALKEARRRGAATALVTCNPDVPARAARVVIALAVGPEVLTGSTRLKAGTATKLALNTLTTASFARLGKVYGNRMVDLQPRSAKLRERAVRLIAEIAGVRPPRARRALAESGGSVRVAIVIARYGLSRRRAVRVLRDAGGSLRGVLQRPRRKELTRTRTGPSLKAKRSQPKGRTIAAAVSQNVPFLQKA
jgi:N-acetylmuramic acid 6-phosphate etherase